MLRDTCSPQGACKRGAPRLLYAAGREVLAVLSVYPLCCYVLDTVQTRDTTKRRPTVQDQVFSVYVRATPSSHYHYIPCASLSLSRARSHTVTHTQRALAHAHTNSLVQPGATVAPVPVAGGTPCRLRMVGRVGRVSLRDSTDTTRHSSLTSCAGVPTHNMTRVKTVMANARQPTPRHLATASMTERQHKMISTARDVLRVGVCSRRD